MAIKLRQRCKKMKYISFGGPKKSIFLSPKREFHFRAEGGGLTKCNMFYLLIIFILHLRPSYIAMNYWLHLICIQLIIDQYANIWHTDEERISKNKPVGRTRCKAVGASVPVRISKMDHLHISNSHFKSMSIVHLSALDVELLEKIEWISLQGVLLHILRQRLSSHGGEWNVQQFSLLGRRSALLLSQVPVDPMRRVLGGARQGCIFFPIYFYFYKTLFQGIEFFYK